MANMDELMRSLGERFGVLAESNTTQLKVIARNTDVAVGDLFLLPCRRGPDRFYIFRTTQYANVLSHQIEISDVARNKLTMPDSYLAEDLSDEKLIELTGMVLGYAEWNREQALWDFHRSRGAIATLVLREDPVAERWGLVEVGDQDRILRITGRGVREARAISQRMFAGIHILHPRLLQQVPKEVASSIIDPYIAAIERGESVLGYDLHGYWSDIGTAERYTQAEHDARSGLIRLEERSPHSAAP